MNKAVPFEEGAVRQYLDERIRYWRKQRASYAKCYLDAYQTMRSALFGKCLAEEHKHGSL